MKPDVTLCMKAKENILYGSGSSNIHRSWHLCFVIGYFVGSITISLYYLCKTQSSILKKCYYTNGFPTGVEGVKEIC